METTTAGKHSTMWHTRDQYFMQTTLFNPYNGSVVLSPFTDKETWRLKEVTAYPANKWSNPRYIALNCCGTLSSHLSVNDSAWESVPKPVVTKPIKPDDRLWYGGKCYN